MGLVDLTHFRLTHSHMQFGQMGQMIRLIFVSECSAEWKENFKISFWEDVESSLKFILTKKLALSQID